MLGGWIKCLKRGGWKNRCRFSGLNASNRTPISDSISDSMRDEG
jgi:hypothetical protein